MIYGVSIGILGIFVLRTAFEYLHALLYLLLLERGVGTLPLKELLHLTTVQPDTMLQTSVYHHTTDGSIDSLAHPLGTDRTAAIACIHTILLPRIIQYKSKDTVVYFMYYTCLMPNSMLQILF